MLSAPRCRPPAESYVSPEPGADTHCSSLLYNFSILRDKVKQVESLVGMVVISPSQMWPELVPMAVTSAGAAVQEIISAASSMVLAFQQLALDTAATTAPGELCQHNAKVSHEGSSQRATSGALTGRGGGCYFHGEAVLPQGGYSTASIHTSGAGINEDRPQAKIEMGAYRSGELSAEACEIIELRASDVLAKYTHYCQVCGKGFKRDANLRMHMRAHGDEYKTNAALSNPLKQHGNKHLLGFDGSCSTVTVGSSGRKQCYSCPQEGCRWNRKHPRFQPLKSMVCAKKHYRRSHCPKMYVCHRCNRKQFSVLSDLRAHEKHCGDLRWQCSCGTTFSRKDKLMGHVSLFVGHAPAAECPPTEASR